MSIIPNVRTKLNVAYYRARARDAGKRLSSQFADVGQDLVVLGMAAGCLLRINELAVHLDLEHAPPRRDDPDVLEGVLELF